MRVDSDRMDVPIVIERKQTINGVYIFFSVLPGALILILT